MEMTPEIQAVIDSAVESAIGGLKAKNQELLDKNKKLMKGQEIDPQTVIDLEAQIDKLTIDLSAANKASKESAKVMEALQGQLSSESSFTSKLLLDNGLTDALVKAGVSAPFLPAVKAMLSSQAKIAIDGDTRKAVIGDKDLSAFVTEWATSDDGKHYISAPSNSGGGASGGSGSTGQQVVNRSTFDAMSHPERASFAKSGGKVTD
jgi:hypothetical protein